MKIDMEKAQQDLRKRVEAEGLDACHLCGRRYRAYEHSYHGVTREGGDVVAVCVECLGKLEYGIGFGLQTPPDADADALRMAFYTHPWNDRANRQGTH